MTETDGLRRLREWLKANEVSQNQLAKKLGISQPAIARWLQGITRPDDQYREMLFQLTGIEITAWRAESETEALQRFSESLGNNVLNTGTDDA